MTTYFSVDLEYTGPCPPQYQVLSIGCAAYNEHGEELSTFHKGIHYQILQWDYRTLEFWTEQGQTFKDLLVNSWISLDPERVWPMFSDWVQYINQSDDTPVLIADPIAADWPWIVHGFTSVGIDNPFRYKGLCLNSYIRAKLRLDLWAKVRDLYPSEHAHDALADARAQGKTYFRFRDASVEELEEMRRQLTSNDS